jgi:Fic family protein
VKDLSLPPEGDGSRRPGIYRNTNNQISQSKHRPPDHTQVNGLMEELLQFINEPNAPQYDLLKTAVAHHRFAAIHPFDNGNGRTARLVTYAMLTRQRFIDEKGFRLLNPSAIFCMDRQKYYDMLAEADKGGMGNIIQWCEYVLSGIKAEIGKIDKLLDASFSIDNIILPALKLALDKKQINQVEHDVLRVAAHKSLIQVHDIQHIFGQSASDRVKASRSIKRLREQGFLMIHPKYKLKYVLRFSDNYLLRGVIQQLDVHDLLPISPNA